MKSKSLFIFLIHHNQPELLKYQINYFRKQFPEATLIIGLTCNVNISTHKADQMFHITDLEQVSVIESDTGKTLFNKWIQIICASWLIRKLVLRVPILRKLIGQDPSSGHARLLNKLTRFAMELPIDSEVWFVEGDILPVTRPENLPRNVGLCAPVYFFEKDRNMHPYLNPRILQFKISSPLIKAYRAGLLDWAPHMGMRFWFDTGSRTHKLLLDKNLVQLINIREMKKLVAGSWDQSVLEFKVLRPERIQTLISRDFRIGSDEKFQFDLYDGVWLHIGKTSGYFDGQGETVTDHLIAETIAAIFEN